MSKQAILEVSFGTTYKETRAKTIGATEAKVAQTFPDFTVRQAFTSKIVIQRIQEQEGLQIDQPAQALDNLINEGYDTVYIHSLHFLLGTEYETLERLIDRYQSQFKVLKLTRPLLFDFKDFQRVTQFLAAPGIKLGDDEAIMWMGHGSSNNHAFPVYACLDHMLDGTTSYVGAVESYPSINCELDRLVKAQVKAVYLHPLMLVAGNHAHNDMASDAPDSWKSLLEDHEIAVKPILKGLGEYPQIQTMFIDKLTEQMEG